MPTDYEPEDQDDGENTHREPEGDLEPGGMLELEDSANLEEAVSNAWQWCFSNIGDWGARGQALEMIIEEYVYHYPERCPEDPEEQKMIVETVVARSVTGTIRESVEKLKEEGSIVEDEKGVITVNPILKQATQVAEDYSRALDRMND